MDPAVDESSAGVVGERCGLAGAGGERAGEQVGFDQDLKAVADADHGFAGGDKFLQFVAQMVRDLIGEDFSGGDVVAVTEAAGNSEDMEIVKKCRSFQKAIDVDGVDVCAGLLKSMGGFAIAVGAGGAQQQGAGLHGGSLGTFFGRAIRRNGGF